MQKGEHPEYRGSWRRVVRPVKSPNVMIRLSAAEVRCTYYVPGGLCVAFIKAQLTVSSAVSYRRPVGQEEMVCLVCTDLLVVYVAMLAVSLTVV
jgi:hypothetical protein